MSSPPPPPADEAVQGQSLGQMQGAYITALIIENEELKREGAANSALVDTLTKNLHTLTQAVTNTLAIPDQLLREICDADGFKPIDPLNAATMFTQPISTERGSYQYWLQRLDQIRNGDMVQSAGPATSAPKKSRKPRHCTCCGKAHADSRTCGKSHTCLAQTCTA